MKRPVLLAIILGLASPSWAGLGTHDAQYMGGTVATIPERTEGKVSTADATVFVFQYKRGKLTVPYAQIDSLEYGQKAGRRVGLGVMVNPLFLFSKKRRHYLTVGWLDEKKTQQAAVLQLGKSIIGPTLRDLETKTGKSVEYQDQEARKSAEAKKSK